MIERDGAERDMTLREDVERESSGGLMRAFFRLRLALRTSCLKFSLFFER